MFNEHGLHLIKVFSSEMFSSKKKKKEKNIEMDAKMSFQIWSF